MRKSLPDILSRYIVLARSGRVWKGLCPFHEDHSPSFMVYEDGAHCFGCGWHGGAVRFLMDLQRLSYDEAVQILGWQESLPAFVKRPAPVPTKVGFPTGIVDYWHRLLKKEREYFRWRLLSDETIEFYRLGWDGHRYTIPVWDGKPQKSSLLTVRFRNVPGVEPRYSSLKGYTGRGIFNSFAISREAYVFFGELDALLAWQDGMAAVSPICGKEAFDPSFVPMFGQSSRVIVVPDRGELKTAYDVASLFGLGRGIVVQLPPGAWKDYTEFRQAGNSAERFEEEVARVL